MNYFTMSAYLNLIYVLYKEILKCFKELEQFAHIKETKISSKFINDHLLGKVRLNHFIKLPIVIVVSFVVTASEIS